MTKLLYFVLRKLLFKLIKKKKTEYNRFLSIPDYLIDRLEKAKLIGFGEGTSVYDSCLVLGNVSVGNNTWIGPYTILDGTGNLFIGNNCDICAGVQIYTHSTVNRIINGSEIEKAPVIIGNNVYIGPNVIVSMGVKIGDRVIIGANSFVNKNIPSNTKVYGTPVKIIESL